MKILFISGREPEYTRNHVIIKGLKENGVEVVQCTDSSKNYLIRTIRVLLKFLFTCKKDVDVIFVGFLGQHLMPFVNMLSKKPIIFDAFISTYDTLCFERKKFKPKSIIGKLLYWLDSFGCKKARKVITDTEQHIDYFTKTFNLDKGKFQRIFVGANDSMFYPRKMKKNKQFTVFYHGSFLPLQGVDQVIRAAKILEDKKIKFVIVGTGIEWKKMMNLANELKVGNIEFRGWVKYKELPLEIAKGDICLGGHFSNIEKAKRVIAGKTYQYLAMKKPTIVGDNKATKELLIHGQNVYICSMNNTLLLANAILALKNNPQLRGKIAKNGYKLFKEKCSPKVLGKQIKELAEKIIWIKK